MPELESRTTDIRVYLKTTVRLTDIPSDPKCRSSKSWQEYYLATPIYGFKCDETKSN